MKPALNFATRKSSYDVIAYDARTQLAVVEIFDRTTSPYQVLLGFEYKKDYEWAAAMPCDDLEQALKLYDELLYAELLMLKHPKKEELYYVKVLSDNFLSGDCFLRYDLGSKTYYFGHRFEFEGDDEEQGIKTKFTKEEAKRLVSEITEQLTIVKVDDDEYSK